MRQHRLPKRVSFTAMPVNRAVISLAVPTVISQIITVVYNMADTFFIGQMNDPNQVAAATISMPLFIFMTALANLFGIGGASLISRSLGIGNRKKLHHALHSAFDGGRCRYALRNCNTLSSSLFAARNRS